MSELNFESTGNHMTANDMWNVVNSSGGSGNWGIDGYESPKIYFDFKKQKSDRERLELNQAVWAKKMHYPKPKDNFDREGNKIIPKKANFIDECVKIANGNFSKQKYDCYVEKLTEKGKTLEEIEGIKKPKEILNNDKDRAKIYKHNRSTIFADVEKNENKKNTIPPDFQEIVDRAKERQGKYTTPAMSESDTMKMKYKGKSSLSKGDRLNFLSECEYNAEKLPFYSTKAEEEEGSGSGEESKGKNKKPKKLFYPQKDYVLSKSPKWGIHQPAKIDKSYSERRQDLYNSKVEDLKKSWDDRRIKFIDDVSTSYFLINDKRKGSFKYNKTMEMSDQYKLSKEQSPHKWPGPQQYFKTPFVNYQDKRSKKGEEEGNSKEDPEGSPKIYYLNRDKTDKRLYKPMKKYVF